MQKFLQRVFRLQPGEEILVIALGFVLFGNSLARQISNIVAVSGFLDAEGVNGMLLVLLVDYIFVLLVAGLQSLFVDRFNRLKLVSVIALLFALVFFILRVLFYVGAPNWLNYSFMYVVSEQQYVLFPLVFWVLANDVLSFAQAKRLFPLIASWSFVGKLVGIGIAGVSADLLARFGLRAEEVLILTGGIYLLVYLALVFGMRHVDIRRTVQKTETVAETLSEGWNFVRDVPSFRFLMVAIFALALTDTIIEFRFLAVTDSVFHTQLLYQRFYSVYKFATALLSFGTQVFLTSRLINRMELKNVFFFMPLIGLVGAIGMIGFPGAAMAISAMLFLKLSRETVDESARKNFQSLVPEERRGRVSTFMDSYLPALGTILACIVTGAIVLVGLRINRDLHTVYLSVAALGAALAVWAILRMRKVYESSLLNWRLKRRQRSTNALLDRLD